MNHRWPTGLLSCPTLQKSYSSSWTGLVSGRRTSRSTPFSTHDFRLCEAFSTTEFPFWVRKEEPRTGARTGCKDPDSGTDAISIPLDALMGMEGLPQSGTGQTALLTGENAAVLYGRHFGPWVPVPLRPLLMERNLLSRARAEGISCAFANAYPSQFIHLAWTKRPAGPALAAHAAGVLTRQEEELARGEAVSSEILNTAWRTRLGLTYLPEVTPEEAGRNLGTNRRGRPADLLRPLLYGHGRAQTHHGGCGGRSGASGCLPRRSDSGPFRPRPSWSWPATMETSRTSPRGIPETLPSASCWGPGAKEFGTGLSQITDIPELILRYLSGVS